MQQFEKMRPKRLWKSIFSASGFDFFSSCTSSDVQLLSGCNACRSADHCSEHLQPQPWYQRYTAVATLLFAGNKTSVVSVTGPWSSVGWQGPTFKKEAVIWSISCFSELTLASTCVEHLNLLNCEPWVCLVDDRGVMSCSLSVCVAGRGCWRVAHYDSAQTRAALWDAARKALPAPKTRVSGFSSHSALTPWLEILYQHSVFLICSSVLWLFDPESRRHAL